MQNNNKKSWIFLAVIIIVLIVVVIVKGHKNKDVANSTDGVIKIGVVSPMSGPKGALGEGLRQATILAQADYGPTKKQYQFIFEDSAGDAVKAASAAEKLILVDRVQMLMSITSQDGNIVGPKAEAAKIPHFGIANDEKVEEGEYNFVHWVSAQSQVDVMIAELQKRNLKNVAFLMEQNDAWVAVEAAFKESIKNTDIKIVFEDKFTKEIMDFRGVLENAKKANPDVIMVESFSPMVETIGKQIKQLGIKTPVTSITSFGTAKDVTPFEGNWYVSGKESDVAFIEKFKAQTGYMPTIGANYGYDITQILFDVFDNAKDTNPDTIVKALKSFDYTKIKSAVGSLRGINDRGRVISDAALLMIKDGKQANYQE